MSRSIPRGSSGGNIIDTLAATLAAGNTTDGTDVEVTNTDVVRGQPRTSGGLPGYALILEGGLGDGLGTASTGQLTVVTAAPGTTIYTSDGVGFSQDLTPAGGVRTSGNNDYDDTLGTTALVAAEIAAAINDPLNSWSNWVSAVAVGSDVDLTALLVGVEGDLLSFGTDSGDITSAGFTFAGGVDPVRSGPIVPSLGQWGALQAANTGNNRGRNAVDLQVFRLLSNQVASGDWSATLGGRGNKSSGQFSFIGSGYLNTASGAYSIVGGGNQNDAAAEKSFIGGGEYNTIGTGSLWSLILGGNANAIDINTVHAAVLWGSFNSIDTGANWSVAGGTSNIVGASTYSTAFGQNNSIAAGSNQAAILSGDSASIGAGSNHTTILGGANQLIGDGSTHSNIFGGRGSTIGDGATYSFTIGGWGGYIDNNVDYSSVQGGYFNEVYADQATVTHGAFNQAHGIYSRVGGRYGRARNYGEDTFAPGQFSALGDAQRVEASWFGSTTNAAAKNLTLDNGFPTGVQFLIPANCAMKFTWEITVWKASTKEMYGFKLSGRVKRGVSVATTAIVGTPSLESDGDAALAAVLISATVDVATGALVPQVTGIAATTLQWGVTMTGFQIVG